MEKYYSLTIPTWIDGINTVINIGEIGITHTVFESGLSKQSFYKLLGKSDLSNTSIKMLVPNVADFYKDSKFSIGGWQNTDLTPIMVTEDTLRVVLSNLVRCVEERWKILEDTNCKNFQVYNSRCNNDEDKMLPVIICVMDFDKVADCKSEGIEELIKKFIKMGRVTGFTLMLHSSEELGIREHMDSGLYSQFMAINISVSNEPPKDINIYVCNTSYQATIKHAGKA